MASTPLLIEMTQRIDASLAWRALNTAYWRGRQPLAYLSPEAAAALGNRLGIISVNFPRVAITAIAERLRLVGFTGVDVWDDLLRIGYDLSADTLHREALLQGEAFACVWTDDEGQPAVTIESGETVAVKRDPVTRQIVAAAKRVRTKSTPATDGHTDMWIYTPAWVQHWNSNSPGGAGDFVLVDQVPNPLGVVPVVSFVHAPLLPSVWAADSLLYREYSGESYIEPLKPLVDALNKTVADLLVAQEYTARPRRWATGLAAMELPEVDDNGNPVLDTNGNPVITTQNPIPEGNRAMLSENPESRFGQLPGADLQGFRTSVDIWIQAIMAVTALPAHYVGTTTNNPATSEAMQAAESQLTSRAEAVAKMMGLAHEQVAKLVYAIRTGADPSTLDVQASWGPFDQSSQAASADAATKLYQAGVISRSSVLRRMGFDDDQITQELEDMNSDTALGHDIAIGRYMRDTLKPSKSA